MLPAAGRCRALFSQMLVRVGVRRQRVTVPEDTQDLAGRALPALGGVSWLCSSPRHDSSALSCANGDSAARPVLSASTGVPGAVSAVQLSQSRQFLDTAGAGRMCEAGFRRPLRVVQ